MRLRKAAKCVLKYCRKAKKKNPDLEGQALLAVGMQMAADDGIDLDQLIEAITQIMLLVAAIVEIISNLDFS